MEQAQLDCYSFGIICPCFNFFYTGALMICLNRMTKGMSRIETTGPAQANISAGIQISAERLAMLLDYP
ncbi:hypothetical protein GQ457_04G024320 [Hibiscus cannabinus]